MKTIEVTEAELAAITKAREDRKSAIDYNRGLETAAQVADAWAAEAGGGSGMGGEGYRNLAMTIRSRAMKVTW